MKHYAIRVCSVFNNGKDVREEDCRNKRDAEKRQRYYEKDGSVLSVEIIEC